eukprot:s385_g8.t1
MCCAFPPRCVRHLCTNSTFSFGGAVHGRGSVVAKIPTWRRLPWHTWHTLRRSSASNEDGMGNQTEDPADLPGSKAAILAWLEDRAATEEGQEIGTLLFLAKSKNRAAAAEEALALVKTMLSADSMDLQKDDRVALSKWTRRLSDAAKRCRWQTVGSILDGLKEQGLEANVIVYNAAINAVGKGKQWKFGLWLLSSMKQQGCSPNTISRNAILSACEKTACWKTALTALWKGEIPSRDLISFNTALSSCVRSNWEEAFGVFAAMTQTEDPKQPDAFTCSGLVRACESKQKWKVALGLCIQMINSKIQLNVVTYSAAISACQSASQWEQALFFFGSMCSMAMLPNVISYSAILSACERGGQWQRSLTLLAQMGEAKIIPDSVACGAALSACETGQQWQLALHLLFQMPVSGMKLDSVCFASAISTCSRSRHWKDVLKLVEAMLQMGISDFSIARYQHSSQAGSTLDCFKHSVFLMLLQKMISDPSPVTCIDTHAGPALYDLGGPAQRGILQLIEAPQSGPAPSLGGDLLHAYINAAMVAGTENVQQSFVTATATVQQENSYWQLAHQQSESRSLILMDPPYDPYETYMAWNLFLLQHFYEKWPQSCVLLWFPYLDDDQVAGLYQRLKLLQLDDVLVAEFGVQETETLETSGRQLGT